jgi:hypothetical protein
VRRSAPHDSLIEGETLICAALGYAWLRLAQ